MFCMIIQIGIIARVWFYSFDYNIDTGDDSYVETVKMESDSDVGMLYHSWYPSDHIPGYQW